MAALDHDLEAFESIDWRAPLDADAVLEGVPPGVTVKGMFIARLVRDAERAGVSLEGTGTYRSFKDYPLRELMDIELAIAREMFAEIPLREALRRLGRTAFPTLMESLIGRVIFAPAGRDLGRVIRLASKGYKVSISDANVSVVDIGEPHGVIVRLSRLYNFAGSFQVGVFEGAVEYYDCTPNIRIRDRGVHDVDLLVRWTPRTGDRPASDEGG